MNLHRRPSIAKHYYCAIFNISINIVLRLIMIHYIISFLG